jgi:muramoyltetrapeptide carboxypeptidase
MVGAATVISSRAWAQAPIVGAAAGGGSNTAPLRALQPPRPLIKPPRLQPGQTIGLVAPSGAVPERLPLEIAHDTLTALGFKVKESPQLRARRGHFAGTDEQRAASLNAMFADPDVQGVLAITGGSGANRILPLLDYAQLRRTPKFVGGFSDITALLHAVHSQTGLVTYHCPAGVSEWNEFSWRHFRGVKRGRQGFAARPARGPYPDDQARPGARPSVGRELGGVVLAVRLALPSLLRRRDPLP